MPDFIPGLQLSEMYYQEAVRPLLAAGFPGLRYSAALIGYGSDVIGFDNPVSADHLWGPRLYLFVPAGQAEQLRPAILESLGEKLPHRFHGYSTHFGSPDGTGVRLPVDIDHGPISPLIWVYTLRAYLQEYLGHDLSTALTPADWLTFSEHKLLSLVKGSVFYDGLGELEDMRIQLAFYPHAIWLYLLASEWQKIGQEGPFVGRAGDVGDELGSRLIAARLAHSVMRLGFLMERQYPPYSKWFGTGFQRLQCAPTLETLLQEALAANTWQPRQEALARAYQAAARLHNALSITPLVNTEITPFYTRPYRVIQAGPIAETIAAAIQDPAVRALPGLTGSVNQLVDSTDILSSPEFCARLQSLYRPDPHLPGQ